MNFSQVKSWNCGGCKAVAVNPWHCKSDYSYKQFDKWASDPANQPSVDPTLKGEYSAEAFEAPIEQGFSPTVGWVTKEAVNNVVIWSVMAKRLYMPLKQPVEKEREVKGEGTITDEYLKSLPFHDKYFSNETWHPDKADISYMGQESYDKAMAEWQELEDVVLFEGFRVSFDSCDCGDGYGCSHGSWPYEISQHGFDGVDMSWEDDGFFIESPKGFIRFDKTSDITMYHFVKACELLDLKLTFRNTYPNHQ